MDQTENKSNLPAMSGCTMLRSSTTGCTIQNLWVKELRYLSVHILQSRTFKCSLLIYRKAVYRSANAIFGKIGLIVPEDVILQLIKSTCISSLLYDVDACALTKSVGLYV